MFILVLGSKQTNTNSAGEENTDVDETTKDSDKLKKNELLNFM